MKKYAVNVNKRHTDVTIYHMKFLKLLSLVDFTNFYCVPNLNTLRLHTKRIKPGGWKQPPLNPPPPPPSKDPNYNKVKTKVIWH